MSEEHEAHKEHHEHREERKLELPRRKRKNMFWMVVSGVLFGLLIISMFTSGFTSLSQGQVSGQQAGEKAVKYINEVLLQGKMTATLGDVKDVGDLYNAKISLSGQIFDSYITKDGRLLFPQAVDLTKAAEPATGNNNGATQAKSCEDMPKQDKPTVEIFYMAYCPYGVQAVKGLYPVAKLFGDKVDIQPHFVIYENYQGGSANYCLNNGKLCSMHGVEELKEDIRQACIYKYQKDKFWDYTNCAMTECTLNNINTCWETCADKNNVDKAKVKDCADKEGISLMEAEKALNAKKNVEGSPTIFVNNVPYEGGRAPDQFKENICCGFKTKPSECTQALASGTSPAAGSCAT